MILKSHQMSLSYQEKHWLPWFGNSNKLSLLKSCYLNKKIYPTIEKTFESIAATRVKLLDAWVNNQWSQLHVLLEQVEQQFPFIEQGYLLERKKRVADVSEYFVIDQHGKVLNSTHSSRINKTDLPDNAVQLGLNDAFLHGPYVDPETLLIGPSSSTFHDAVTLMFYLPIKKMARVSEPSVLEYLMMYLVT